jgi:hypothetical protein
MKIASMKKETPSMTNLGDELYRTLAKRWMKVMAALFAAGVVTGTILVSRRGLLWPSLTASFGNIFRLCLACKQVLLDRSWPCARQYDELAQLLSLVWLDRTCISSM